MLSSAPTIRTATGTRSVVPPSSCIQWRSPSACTQKRNGTFGRRRGVGSGAAIAISTGARAGAIGRIAGDGLMTGADGASAVPLGGTIERTDVTIFSAASCSAR